MVSRVVKYEPDPTAPGKKDFKIYKAKDVNGKPITIKHHTKGHVFKDNNTYEKPHHHGQQGQHYTY